MGVDQQKQGEKKPVTIATGFVLHYGFHHKELCLFELIKTAKQGLT